MIRFLQATLRIVAILTLTSLTLAQQPEPPRSGHDIAREDPRAYCTQHETDSPHAHPCKCAFMCAVAPNGEPYAYEDSTCTFYCLKNPSHCVCHADETCPD